MSNRYSKLEVPIRVIFKQSSTFDIPDPAVH